MRDIDLARSIAQKFHAGQRYGIHDYMYHLDSVADSVAGEFDDRLQVIAILHDILEDTECTEDLLLQLFDKDVVEAVKALTKRSLESYEGYIAKVKGNALALTVKKHDSLCNLRESMLRRDTKRVRKYSSQIALLCE